MLKWFKNKKILISNKKNQKIINMFLTKKQIIFKRKGEFSVTKDILLYSLE